MTDMKLVLGMGHPEVVSHIITDCVVDIGKFGDLVGIEIMGLGQLLDADRLNRSANEISAAGDLPRCAYDTENDVMYVTISDDRSLDQEVRTCKILMTRNGTIAGLELANIAEKS